MFLASLRLRNFRNFADQRIEFVPAGALIVGDNGQGKTNLLEAIYYLEIFRSFRGAADEQLVHFGEEVFRIDAEIADGSRLQVAAAFDRKSRKKKVSVNGLEPDRLADAIGGVGVVVFSPGDVEIVAGAPSARRRFLDILLSRTAPGYLNALQRFRQVVLRRNALLRQGAPAAQVAAWNAGLVEWGSRITAARAEWVREHAAAFAERAATIAGGAAARLEYAPCVGDPKHETGAVAAAFHAELERVAERERRRGVTLVGPHRDDLRTFGESAVGGWIDLRTFGSGGQQRTAAVALRMVEAETLRATRGTSPILLLDDVFAELDAGRARRILAWVDAQAAGRQGQVLLTAPKASEVAVAADRLPRWTIRDGLLAPA